MKVNKTVSSIFRQVPMMVLLLAAFVFSASKGLQPLLQEDVAKAEQQQQQQEKDDDHRPVAYLDYACDAIAPVAQFLLFQATFTVPMPVQQVLQEGPALIPSPRGSDQFFRILFRLIISPNAP